MQILELNHVAIHVRDLEAACEFYKNILRLEPLPRPAFDFPGAWFRLGTQQELHLIGERTAPVHSHNRGNHFALRVDDIDQWEKATTPEGDAYTFEEIADFSRKPGFKNRPRTNCPRRSIRR